MTIKYTSFVYFFFSMLFHVALAITNPTIYLLS